MEREIEQGGQVVAEPTPAAAVVPRMPAGDRAFALTLPALIVMALLWLALNVAAQVLAPAGNIHGLHTLWWTTGSVGAAAAGALLFSVLRPLSAAARAAVALIAVLAGAATLAAYSALSMSLPWWPVLAVAPVLAVGLAVPAYRLTAPAFDVKDPFDMAALTLTWGFAVIAPFVFSPLVMWLSNKAGNAGMDTIGVYIMPFAGVVTWWAARVVAGLAARFAAPSPEVEPLSLRRFWAVVAASGTGMCALSLGVAWAMR